MQDALFLGTGTAKPDREQIGRGSLGSRDRCNLNPRYDPTRAGSKSARPVGPVQAAQAPALSALVVLGPCGPPRCQFSGARSDWEALPSSRSGFRLRQRSQAACPPCRSVRARRVADRASRAAMLVAAGLWGVVAGRVAGLVASDVPRPHPSSSWSPVALTSLSWVRGQSPALMPRAKRRRPVLLGVGAAARALRGGPGRTRPYIWPPGAPRRSR